MKNQQKQQIAVANFQEIQTELFMQITDVLNYLIKREVKTWEGNTFFLKTRYIWKNEHTPRHENVTETKNPSVHGLRSD